MKSIEYKTAGAMLVPDTHGTLIRKDIGVTAEIPYSEENLQRAEADSLPGSVQIHNRTDHDLLHGATSTPQEGSVLQQLILKDRATGQLHELHVDNGKLMMEVM